MKTNYFSHCKSLEEVKRLYKKLALQYHPDIIHFDITIEICGNWIWLSGNTRRYSKQLKEIGFFYSPRKQMWYWRPSGWESNNHKPWDIDQIRKRYGSDIIDVQLKLELNSEKDH
jgi:hypothetical protein